MRIIFSILFFALYFTNIISANEKNYYLILKNNEVNVRYGPGFDYPVKYVYKKKNLPIKVIDKKENFRKIIDHKKNSGWIHISQLKPSKSLIILEDKIVFKKPNKFSKPILKLQSGRLVLVKKCKINWCKIKTENYAGWILNSQVWGLID